jgi:hypothetical protein
MLKNQRPAQKSVPEVTSVRLDVEQNKLVRMTGQLGLVGGLPQGA